MFWFLTQVFGLCVVAFLAGAVVAWLPLRATIRDLRAAAGEAVVRPALPVAPTAVVIPPQVSPVEDREVGDVEIRPAGVEDVEVRDPGIRDPEIPGAEPVEEVRVKGSSKSMIFHTPASPYFKRMKGDVTFRSVAEAERAGYTRWVPRSRVAALPVSAQR